MYTNTTAVPRVDLAESLQEFDLQADRAGFIGLQVLPVFEVTKQAASFGRIPIEALLRNVETGRRSGASYNVIDWPVESDSYATVDQGIAVPVDDRNAKIYAQWFDAEMEAAEIGRDAVLRRMEKRIADAIFNASTWTGASLTTGVSVKWATRGSTPTPCDDVEAAIRKVHTGTGVWPNALIVTRQVFRDLRLCDQVTDKLASLGAGVSIEPGKITAAQLATVFDLEKVIVAGGTQNTADEGQSATLSSIWSNAYAMVAKVATTQALREPCLGRTFHWGEDGSQIGGAFESYRDEPRRSDMIRHRMDVHNKIFAAGFGHLLSNIT